MYHFYVQEEMDGKGGMGDQISYLPTIVTYFSVAVALHNDTYVLLFS